MGKYNRHVAAVLGAPALLAILFAAPALATENNEDNGCDVTVRTDLTGVEQETRIVGDKPGVAKIGGNGLRVKTPAAGSKVHAYFDVDPVKPLKVDALKFKSIKNESVTVVAPSYQLGIDLNGNGVWDQDTDAIAVWEAYQNGHNPPVADEPVSYDAHEIGAAKYWFTKPIPGLAAGAGTQANPVPFGDFATAVKPNVKILFFGLNQGSGNAGADTTWISVRFKAGNACTVYKWKKPDATESPTASPTVTPDDLAHRGTDRDRVPDHHTDPDGEHLAVGQPQPLGRHSHRVELARERRRLVAADDRRQARRPGRGRRHAARPWRVPGHGGSPA